MYPDDKETWRRLINQDLPAEPGTTIEEDDFNLKSNFLESLQDTLGYNIKMGYASVKDFFDYIITQLLLITGKVNKTGDTMTGDLTIAKVDPLLQLKVEGASGTTFFEALDDSDAAFDETGVHNVKCFKISGYWEERFILFIGNEEGTNWIPIISGSFEEINFKLPSAFVQGLHSLENINLPSGKTVDGVDVSEIPTTYLKLAGDTMTGRLSFSDGFIEAEPDHFIINGNTVALDLKAEEDIHFILEGEEKLALLAFAAIFKEININMSAGKTVDGRDISEDLVKVEGDTMTGDLEFPTTADGIILKDRTTATRYRLKIDNGVLGIEAVI